MSAETMAICPKCGQRFYISMCIVHKTLDDSNGEPIFCSGYQCPKCLYYSSRTNFKAVSIEEVMV